MGLPAFSVGVPRHLAGLPAGRQVGLSALAFFAENSKKALKQMPQSLTPTTAHEVTIFDLPLF
ncbi:MAG: hypothetical protein Q7U59_14395 [Lutibacter sp.]|nr:hypothetical protein [Lutibacter sp.]